MNGIFFFFLFRASKYLVGRNATLARVNSHKLSANSSVAESISNGAELHCTEKNKVTTHDFGFPIKILELNLRSRKNRGMDFFFY